MKLLKMMSQMLTLQELKIEHKTLFNESYGYIIKYREYYICDCKDGYEEKLLEEIKKYKPQIIQLNNEKLSKILLNNGYYGEDVCVQAVYKGPKVDCSELINIKKRGFRLC